MKQIIILILVLFLVSCEYKPVEEIATEAIDFEILQPKEESAVSDEVQIVTKIKNNGDSQAEGFMCITGLDENIFSGYTPCSCESFLVEEGKEERILFPFYSIMKEENEEQELTAILHAEYSAYGLFKACIRKDPYSEDCKPERNLLEYSSKGPISISSVTQETVKTRDTLILNLDITLKHTGKGSLWDKDLLGDCFPSDVKREIEVELLDAPGTARCGQLVFEKMADYEKALKGGIKIRCTVKDVEPKDYEPRLTLELRYAYELIKSRSFKL